jgi:MFS family permease
VATRLGFLLGPLATPCFRRHLGEWVNPLGMGLETAGFLGLAWLISATPDGMAPASRQLAVLLFLIGFGQGLGLPTLMTMITGRVAPAHAGMIAGIASSTLQVSTALSVALVGGIFYTVLGGRDDPAAIAHAFVLAALCIALCLGAGVGLGMTLARRAAVASTQGHSATTGNEPVIVLTTATGPTDTVHDNPADDPGRRSR